MKKKNNKIITIILIIILTMSIISLYVPFLFPPQNNTPNEENYQNYFPPQNSSETNSNLNSSFSSTSNITAKDLSSTTSQPNPKNNER